MWAIVTGASSGIGMEIAKELAKKKYNLVLVARSEDKLKALSESLSVETKIVAVDLTQEAACKVVFEECKELEVQILVNNAGFGGHGRFEDRSSKDDLNMIRLNVSALTELCHLFIPKLKESSKGYILNVASSAGFLPGPGMAVYYATKAYVLSLSEALYEELKDEQITVTALCPGPVETGFAKIAGMNGVKAFKQGLVSAEFVAKKAIEGMFNGKAIVIPSLKLNLVLRLGLRFLPRSAVRKISKETMSKN